MEKYTAVALEGASATLSHSRKRGWHLVYTRAKHAAPAPSLEAGLAGRGAQAVLPHGWWEVGRGPKGQARCGGSGRRALRWRALSELTHVASPTHHAQVLCSNAELAAFNQRLEAAAAECRSLSALQLGALAAHVRAALPQLRRLLDALALLDLLAGFAGFMRARQAQTAFCRPEITPHGVARASRPPGGRVLCLSVAACSDCSTRRAPAHHGRPAPEPRQRGRGDTSGARDAAQRLRVRPRVLAQPPAGRQHERQDHVPEVRGRGRREECRA